MTQPERLDEAAFLRDVKAKLAGIYHDMNNPLAVASGNVQFIDELVRMGDLEGVSEALDDVRAALELIEGRLQDVLELRHALDDRLAATGDE